MSLHPRTHDRSRFVSAVILTVVSASLMAQQGTNTSPGAPGPSFVLDVVATDRAGAAVDDLSASDFTVSVDGVRRTVTSLRYVTRGPGAVNDAQALGTARGTSARFAAEPARTVLVVIDQTTLVRGDEKATTAAVRGVIDRLGLDDRVSIVRLPLSGRQPLVFDNDRPSLLASLRQVMGQASVASVPQPIDPFATGDTGRPVALNPERAGSEQAGGTEPPRLAITDDRPSGQAGTDGRTARSNLADLQALIVSLGTAPGRKTVMLFSGGLTAAGGHGSADAGASDLAFRALVDDVSLAAAESHVVIQAFGLKSSRLSDVAPDAAALEAFARATGGQFAALGKNVDQAIGRLLGDLASCYVLNVEVPTDARSRHTLQITSSRPNVVVRAPAWLVSRPDAADTLPSAFVAPQTPALADQEVARGIAESGPRAVAPAPKRPLSPAQVAQLRRLLARAADYVETYQREYSSVVAEEEYEQTDRSPGASTPLVRLTSDLLLVRLPQMTGWVAFRDVYEVNGTPLREREQRLQRLFLDPSIEARARLEAIQFESSKYNLGPVKRTVNTPLFSLLFLERAVQPRFAFTLKNAKEVDGLQVWELEYRETASPTIAGTVFNTDQPAQGRFLVDAVSGAVVESETTYARRNAGQVDYDVRYRRDEKLGLWLPIEMKETYNMNGRVLTQGVARYRNFRRFQVSTDTRVTVPK